jgi:hypothetical protein
VTYLSSWHFWMSTPVKLTVYKSFPHSVSYPCTMLFPFLCRSILVQCSSICLFLLFLALLLRSHPKNHCPNQYHGAFPLFSSSCFIVLGFICEPLIQFELSFLSIYNKTRIQFYSSACGYPVFLVSFIVMTILLPLWVFSTFIENQLDIKT